MSLEKQREFKEVVRRTRDQWAGQTTLSEPRFEDAGFVSTARMEAPGGAVELLYGPPEYHAEIFITTPDAGRWSLADLMEIETVRQWLLKTPPMVDDRSTLELEVTQAFRLLAEGLKGVSGFEWLHRP